MSYSRNRIYDVTVDYINSSVHIEVFVLLWMLQLIKKTRNEAKSHFSFTAQTIAMIIIIKINKVITEVFFIRMLTTIQINKKIEGNLMIKTSKSIFYKCPFASTNYGNN